MFRIAPNPIQKLSLLDNATQFEPAGGDPIVEKEATGTRAPKPLPCISDVSTPQGKKPVLKAMMTTACERNCFYCPFRAGRSKMNRVTFTPDEMAKSYDVLEKSGHVQGLFLSSGIIKGGVTTQDKIIDTAEILRRKHNYRGYIHLKIMPGAEYDQIQRAMQLADRVSINLEGATAQRLQALAPKKDYWNELFRAISWASQIRKRNNLRTSIVTQFVVGAVGDTDLELLSVTEKLYGQMGLRRSYFSAFNPVSQTPFEELTPVNPLREHRLYQASFLLRDYGFSIEDLPFAADTNLPLSSDPKLLFAEMTLKEAPVEVNHATRQELLRIPGIGPLAADAILKARGKGNFSDLSHLKAAGVRDIQRASPFILINGKRPPQQLGLGFGD